MRSLVTAAALLVAAGFAASAFAQSAPTNVSTEPGKDRRAEHAARHAERFKALDTDSDGRISKAEFLVGAEQMFARLDKNGDGALATEEMRRGPHRHHRHGQPATPAPEGQPKQQ